MANGKSYMADFPNGFKVTYIEKSSSDGSPSVEFWTSIRIRNASLTVEFEIAGKIVKIRYQKLHFITDD